MKDVKEFCYKYEARVSPGKTPWRRAKRITYPAFEEYGMSAFENLPVDELATVDISMPEDRFRALLEHDSWLESVGRGGHDFFNSNISRVSNMIDNHERECRLRQQHPAVQKAWEHYQVMLQMVDSGK